MWKITLLHIILVLIGLLLFYYVITIRNEKVISVYKEDTYFGLGDYIRGIIHLYQVERRKTIKVDYSKHPISEYIENNFYNNEPVVKRLYKTDEKNYKEISKISGTISVEHNGMHTYPISDDIRKIVQKIFTPKKKLKKEIKSTLKTLKLEPKKFVIVHVRRTDSNMMKETVTIPPRLVPTLNNLRKMNVPVLVISNSYTLKQVICNTYDFKTTSTEPVHTGLVEGSPKGDLKDTLIDFFLISNATHIYQYNEEKGFQSGFSQRIADLYNIPITQI